MIHFKLKKHIKDMNAVRRKIKENSMQCQTKCLPLNQINELCVNSCASDEKT